VSTDLFGEVPPQLKHTYGYAGQPGAGPAGETCKSCRWRKRVHHGTRHYNKCGHARGRNTFSEASDIRVSAPACQFWEGSPS
jgi:hypothetical protein